MTHTPDDHGQRSVSEVRCAGESVYFWKERQTMFSLFRSFGPLRVAGRKVLKRFC